MSFSEGQLFGRAQHLAAVADTLSDAGRGAGGALVIKGEAGIGKTTLLRRALDSADGMAVLRASCVEPESTLPFAGLHLLLRRLEARLDDLVPDQADILRCALGRADVRPVDRHSVNLAVLALLTALSAERPLLVAVDDAHWLDRPSADALLFSARRLDTLRVVMLLAVRDGHAPALPAPGLPELRLDRLSGPDSDALLAAHANDLPSHVRRQIAGEARGNPLALLELSAAHRNGVTTGAGLPVEGTLRATFADRIAALAQSTRTMVLIAAADGTCDTGTVLAAAEQLGAGVGDLTAAEEAELLMFTHNCIGFRHPLARAAAYATASLPERIAAHRALAAVLTKPEHAHRRAWHLAAAATGPDETVASELERSAEQARARGGYAAVATAYERAAQLTPSLCTRARRLSAASRAAADAGQPDRALDLIRQAESFCATTAARVRAAMIHAMIADDQNRFSESYGVLRRTALDIVASDDSGDDDSGVANGDSASHLLFWAAHSAWLGGEPAKVKQAADDATRLGLPAAPHARTLVRVAVGSPAQSAEALRELVEQSTSIFPRCDDRPLELRGHLAVATWHLLLGDHSAARDLALAVVRECRTEAAEGVLAPALAVLARAELALGLHERAAGSAEEGLRFAEESGQSGAAAQLTGVLDHLAAMRGGLTSGDSTKDTADTASARTVTAAGRASFTEQSHALALLDLGHGRHDAALQRLHAIPCADGFDMLRLAPQLAEAVARAQHTDQDTAWWRQQWSRARDVVAAHAEWARRSGLHWAVAVALRNEALLAERAPNDTDEGVTDAGALFARAVELHRHDDRHPFERARTELNYGEWLRRKRRTTEARTHLRAASMIFESLGARPWAERARAELRASGEGVARSGAAGPELAARLTPQEQRIVTLAADGLSNRDIGERLFLSPRTVGYHLYKAYPKLGVSSRRELARLGLAG
ncbi:helix-turn-helix transcriptional regulator [Saccharomonospora xinjiangensis]|uniref:Transcriptional regulator, luxR family n=1 Tax=Saccharomonospora xinjiangensis XJ-54 TaxID=882086 RepID=I0V336_9PSEU|nr:LuxR family transcriptional regulator [Saccharomonospora xinjiangensis]EID54539.1 transcriptional regulator, luxR family [Saccharomonospora xinjiangensis XJ-54]